MNSTPTSRMSVKVPYAPLEALLIARSGRTLAEWSDRVAAEMCGVTRRSIVRWRRFGVPEPSADAATVEALGEVAWTVWPELADPSSIPPAEARPFESPEARANRLRRARERNRELRANSEYEERVNGARRARYVADPEYRERERARSRRNARLRRAMEEAA